MRSSQSCLGILSVVGTAEDSAGLGQFFIKCGKQIEPVERKPK